MSELLRPAAAAMSRMLVPSKPRWAKQ